MGQRLKEDLQKEVDKRLKRQTKTVKLSLLLSFMIVMVGVIGSFHTLAATKQSHEATMCLAEQVVLEVEEATPQVREAPLPEVEEFVTPEAEEAVTPEVEEEMTPEVQDEAIPDVNEDITPPTQEEVVPEVEEEIAPEMKDEPLPEMEEMTPDGSEEALPPVDEDVVPEVEGQDITAGTKDFILKLDDQLPTDSDYNVNISFYAVEEGSFVGMGEQVLAYEIQKLDGALTEGRATFADKDYSGNTPGYTFSLAPGDIIQIKDVPLQFEQWSTLKDVSVDVNLIGANEAYQFEYVPRSILALKDENEMRIQVQEEAGFETSDTFETIGGIYGIKYLLNYYNIISFTDVSATHVVGPIITNNIAYRPTTDTMSNVKEGQCVFSDYSRGISSYIGKLTATDDNELATTNMNYDFDEGQFLDVPLYTQLSTNQVVQRSGQYYFINEGEVLLSPNYTGFFPVLQNDRFMNFDKMKAGIVADLNKILSNEDNEVVSPNSETGYLKVKAGRRYTIENGARLRIIDIQYPEGYDPVTNPYPYNTYLNIVGTELPKSGASFQGMQTDADYPIKGVTYPTINGESHYYFPNTLVDGLPFNGALGQGDGFEYGSNNSILINVPDVSGKTAREAFSDIIAHIVAPKMDFYNYYSNNGGQSSSWHGGNMNGCAIVNSWHGGKMESHMWPYAEGDLDDRVLSDSVQLNLEGTKELINGSFDDFVNNSFKVSLEFIGTQDEADYIEGNKNQIIEVDVNGRIVFETLTFTKAGTYSFMIKEEDNVALEQITYDKSEYQLDVMVQEEGPGLVLSYTLTQLKDETGTPLSQSFNVTNLEFVNRIEEDKFVDLSFIKQDLLTNNPLAQTRFELVEVDETTYEIIEGGFVKTDISVEDGSLQFTEVPVNKTYKLTELNAPQDYEIPTGYWIITIEDNPVTIEIEAVGDVPEIGDDFVITNKLVVNFTISKIAVDTKKPLGGAVFDLYVADEDGNPVGEPIEKNITTDSTGQVGIENSELKLDQLYVLVEIKAPEGYIENDNLIFYIQGTEGLFTEVINVGPVLNGDTLTITNQDIGTRLPDTGGQGVQIFMIIGTGLISSALVLRYINKRRYN